MIKDYLFNPYILHVNHIDESLHYFCCRIYENGHTQ